MRNGAPDRAACHGGEDDFLHQSWDMHPIGHSYGCQRVRERAAVHWDSDVRGAAELLDYWPYRAGVHGFLRDLHD